MSRKRRRGERGQSYDRTLGGRIAHAPRVRRIVRFYYAGGLKYDFAIEEIVRVTRCCERTAKDILRDMRPDIEGELALLLWAVADHGLYSLRDETMRIMAAHIISGNARRGPLRRIADKIRALSRFSLLG
jgi:hypothetical protein